MSDVPIARPPIDHSSWFNRPAKAAASRLQGPGGYYNAGNLLGLAAALTTQFAIGAQASATHSGIAIIVGYFAGSPAAVALTAATLIFFVSGEIYHRAWSGRAVPDACLNQWADALSALGCLALSISLIFLDQWFLAIASGLLSVGGKLGSAVFRDDSSRLGFWPGSWIDPFRGAVLLGRLPGIAAASVDLGLRLLHWDGGSLLSLIQPTVLICCYLLWIKADMLLVGAGKNEEASDARTL